MSTIFLKMLGNFPHFQRKHFTTLMWTVSDMNVTVIQRCAVSGWWNYYKSNLKRHFTSSLCQILSPCCIMFYWGWKINHFYDGLVLNDCLTLVCVCSLIQTIKTKVWDWYCVKEKKWVIVTAWLVPGIWNPWLFDSRYLKIKLPCQVSKPFNLCIAQCGWAWHYRTVGGDFTQQSIRDESVQILEFIMAGGGTFCFLNSQRKHTRESSRGRLTYLTDNKRINCLWILVKITSSEHSNKPHADCDIKHFNLNMASNALLDSWRYRTQRVIASLHLRPCCLRRWCICIQVLFV